MKEGLLDLIRRSGLAHRTAELERALRPAIRLRTRPMPGSPRAGSSRLGGTPDLPPEAPWPEHEGVPMAFVGQIDLADPVPHDSERRLPEKGVLFFFCDALQRHYGSDPADRGSWRVILWDGAPDGLRPAETPAKLPRDARFSPAALEFAPELTLPPLSSDHIAHLGLIGFERHLYWKLWERLHPPPKRPGHQLLGHAIPIQSPMEEECQLVSNGVVWGDAAFLEDPRVPKLIPGLWDWRLLLQVDSDPATGMRWGEGGAIYFWIHQQDLKVCRFDQTWFVLQGS